MRPSRDSFVVKISDTDYAVHFNPFRGCDKTKHFKSEKMAKRHEEKINSRYKTSLSVKDIIK